MEVFHWLGEHWFDSVQTFGIVGGLLLTTYTVRKDELARRISNLLSINGGSNSIWNQFYGRPQLSRVLKKEVDLNEHPVSEEEWVFVKTLLLHLDTVHRAIKAGMFIKINGLESDIRFFLSLPIPNAVWEKIKAFQDGDFVTFVERCLKGK